MSDGEADDLEDSGEGGLDDLPPAPPPPDEDKELLFLIEFLVDTLYIKPENMNVENMDPCLLQGQSCIVMTFLHYPPMYICEKDLDPCKQTGEDRIKFNSGKSLMFALSESQFENPPPIYLEVNAFKAMPHGYVPPKLPIGMTKICLSELFKQVFEKVDEKPDKLPLSKSIKDTYQLLGGKSKVAGEVAIYIRLSCLGQNVVTEFQRGGEECEPFLFKNKESNKIYECKAKDQTCVDDGDNVCPPCPGWGTAVPGAKGKGCGDDRGGAGGTGWNDDEEFEEFGAEVHGHALTIKVQKGKKKDGNFPFAVSDFCDCEVPLPKKMVGGQSKGKSGASSRGGGRGGGAGNQIAVQLPENQSLCKKGGNSAKVFNVGGGGGREVLQVMPEGETDPDKDVFVLRIGKKGEAFGKGKLELELRTPKVKAEGRPKGPRMMNCEVQTEAENNKKSKKK